MLHFKTAYILQQSSVFYEKNISQSVRYPKNRICDLYPKRDIFWKCTFLTKLDELYVDYAEKIHKFGYKYILKYVQRKRKVLFVHISFYRMFLFQLLRNRRVFVKVLDLKIIMNYYWCDTCFCYIPDNLDIKVIFFFCKHKEYKVVFSLGEKEKTGSLFFIAGSLFGKKLFYLLDEIVLILLLR